MDAKHFNAFYRPFLDSPKVKNICTNQFKNNGRILNIVHFSLIMMLVFSLGGLINPSLGRLLLFGSVFLVIFPIFYFVDQISLKKSVKAFRGKYKYKLVFPNLFDQFKYYLWRDKVGKKNKLFSVDKALNHLKIELISRDIEKNAVTNQLPTVILSGITCVAFWKIINDGYVRNYEKSIIDFFVLCISYRFIFFRFFIFEDSSKKLLRFKQYLLRLKSEESNL